MHMRPTDIIVRDSSLRKCSISLSILKPLLKHVNPDVIFYLLDIVDKNNSANITYSDVKKDRPHISKTVFNEAVDRLIAYGALKKSARNLYVNPMLIYKGEDKNFSTIVHRYNKIVSR